MLNPDVLVDGNTTTEPWATTSASYTSLSCEDPLADIGYVTIDLGEPTVIDGVRVHLYQQPGQEYKYCNMYVNVWNEGEPEPKQTIDDKCPGRTPSPTKAPTPAPAPKPTAAPTVAVRGQSCFTCGDLDGAACTRREMLPRNPTLCPEEAPYCMTRIDQDNNQRARVWKYCGTKQECNNDWLSDTYGKPECDNYNPNIYTLALFCTYCCTGDNCNAHLVPDSDNLFGLAHRNRQLLMTNNTMQKGMETDSRHLANKVGDFYTSRYFVSKLSLSHTQPHFPIIGLL